MRRSQLITIRELQAAVAEQPLDLDRRRRLAAAFWDVVDYDGPEIRRWCERAIAEYRQILEIQQNTPGTTRLELLRTQGEITGIRQFLDDVTREEVLAEWTETAAACETELGPAHPETLEALDRLVSEQPALRARITSGREQVLADRLQRLGPDHPDTLAARRELMLCYLPTRPDDAQEQDAEFFAGWARIIAERTGRLGPVHPETVEAREWRAMLVGRTPYEEKVREMERIVADSSRIHGPDHSRTLHLQTRLVSVYRVTDEARAAALAEQIIDLVYRAAEPDWDDVFALRGAIAMHDFGRFESLWSRYPIPADDDDHLFPDDPDYPYDL